MKEETNFVEDTCSKRAKELGSCIEKVTRVLLQKKEYHETTLFQKELMRIILDQSRKLEYLGKN